MLSERGHSTKKWLNGRAGLKTLILHFRYIAFVLCHSCLRGLKVAFGSFVPPFRTPFPSSSRSHMKTQEKILKENLVTPFCILDKLDQLSSGSSWKGEGAPGYCSEVLDGSVMGEHESVLSLGVGKEKEVREDVRNHDSQVLDQ